MLLGIVKEEVYYRYIRESRVVMTPNHEGRGGGRGREGNQVQWPGGQGYKRSKKVQRVGDKNIWIVQGRASGQRVEHAVHTL